jgi:hypothetical protein
LDKPDGGETVQKASAAKEANPMTAYQTGGEAMSDVIANTAGCAGAQGVPDQLLSILPKGTPPELIAAIEDATRKAFNSLGLSAFEMSRDAALAHEVGHTIVATAEG